MKLRTSKILKVVAILLFSLESLVPTVFSTPYGTPEQATFTGAETAFITHHLFLSLYTEACDTEEREDAIGKMPVISAHPIAVQSFPTIQDEEAAHSVRRTQQARWSAAPPLFVLHCTYVI